MLIWCWCWCWCWLDIVYFNQIDADAVVHMMHQWQWVICIKKKIFTDHWHCFNKQSHWLDIDWHWRLFARKKLIHDAADQNNKENLAPRRQKTNDDKHYLAPEQQTTMNNICHVRWSFRRQTRGYGLLQPLSQSSSENRRWPARNS